MKRKGFVAVLWIFVASACMDAGDAQGPTRTITQIAGDLYRAQNNNHFTAFLVTSE